MVFSLLMIEILNKIGYDGSMNQLFMGLIDEL